MDIEPQHTLNAQAITPDAKQMTLIVVALIVGFVIGAVATYYYVAPSSYQSGFNASKALVEKSNLGQFIPNGLSTITGTVTAVQGDRVTIHTDPNNPFADTELAERTVIVDSSTKITKMEPKDPQEFQKEIKAFSSSSPTATSTAPYPFTKTVAVVSDITTGSTLVVSASGNIQIAKEFTATTIQIQPSTATTSPFGALPQ